MKDKVVLQRKADAEQVPGGAQLAVLLTLLAAMGPVSTPPLHG